MEELVSGEDTVAYNPEGFSRPLPPRFVPASMSSAADRRAATLAASREPCLALLRELTRAYQAFATYSAQHVRELGLTPPQFDVIVTLGNTEGLSMGDLAERTLVTKGTLTGIVDRLEAKGLVQRQVPPDNRRSFTIVLTPAGVETFERVFPAHIAYLAERFEPLAAAELTQIQQHLQRLRQLF